MEIEGGERMRRKGRVCDCGMEGERGNRSVFQGSRAVSVNVPPLPPPLLAPPPSPPPPPSTPP